MACYAADLVAGENLLCMTLKADTILRYLQAAAELSIPANMMNPCLDITGKQSKYIRDIITEMKRWESIPDRREPVTKAMVEYIFNKGMMISKSNKDNLYAALADWLILGQQSGFCRKEWAQDCSHLKKFKDIQRNVDESPSAFIINDFEFRGSNNKRIDQNSNNAVNRARIVNVKWRFQKNNDNGQVFLMSQIRKTQYTAMSEQQRELDKGRFGYAKQGINPSQYLEIMYKTSKPLILMISILKQFFKKQLVQFIM